MDASARDALERAAHLDRLERAAEVLSESPARRRDVRALLAAAIALILILYPGMSAAAAMMTVI